MDLMETEMKAKPSVSSIQATQMHITELRREIENLQS